MMSTPVQAEALKAQVYVSNRMYRVGAGDVLSINVYHQKDLEQPAILIRADGNASFAGIGEVPVGGKTIGDIEEALKLAYSELIKEPIITVSVAKSRAGVVYVAGAIKKPGMYQFSTTEKEASSGSSTGDGSKVIRVDLRLSNVLANAGGVTLDADLRSIEIKRDGELLYVADLFKLLESGNPADDITLLSGDTVVVPKLQKMALSDKEMEMILRSPIGPSDFPVRVIGEVGKPGVYALNGESPLLNSAIAAAGGFAPGANRKIVAIRRFTSDGQPMTTFYVKPDEIDATLRPNDVVFVSEHTLYKRGRYFEQVAKALSPFTSALTAIGLANMGN
jgi:polysaccharide export outer membrane protein